jgi:hypothetical protein
MKKKIIGLGCFALCMFLFATLGNLRCPAKVEDSKSEPSHFQTTSTLVFTKGNTSTIEPCGPGSGGGRGPGSIAKLQDSGQMA